MRSLALIDLSVFMLVLVFLGYPEMLGEHAGRLLAAYLEQLP